VCATQATTPWGFLVSHALGACKRKKHTLQKIVYSNKIGVPWKHAVTSR
jgi:hypothetical protein